MTTLVDRGPNPSATITELRRIAVAQDLDVSVVEVVNAGNPKFSVPDAVASAFDPSVALARAAELDNFDTIGELALAALTSKVPAHAPVTEAIVLDTGGTNFAVTPGGSGAVSWAGVETYPGYGSPVDNAAIRWPTHFNGNDYSMYVTVKQTGLYIIKISYEPRGTALDADVVVKFDGAADGETRRMVVPKTYPIDHVQQEFWVYLTGPVFAGVSVDASDVAAEGCTAYVELDIQPMFSDFVVPS